jgi:hypothetical protein
LQTKGLPALLCFKHVRCTVIIVASGPLLLVTVSRGTTTLVFRLCKPQLFEVNVSTKLAALLAPMGLGLVQVMVAATSEQPVPMLIRQWWRECWVWLYCARRPMQIYFTAAVLSAGMLCRTYGQRCIGSSDACWQQRSGGGVDGLPITHVVEAERDIKVISDDNLPIGR